ncbi:McrB family protein [Paenibacillus sp. GCM10023250]|uniref:McrB family protein n=1 Tax=Paenibacillus sp. GCM10023250 TaxID=3252648 RepID=UPI0036216680
MTLPTELSTIFRNRQRSYKMVLVLSIIGEYKQTKLQFLPLSAVAERFLAYYRHRSEAGQVVDVPPANVADSWAAFTLPQTKTLLRTPIDALSAILETSGDTITFQTHIWSMLDEPMIRELEAYATEQLDDYHRQLETQAGFSLKAAFDHLLDNYLSFKTQPFANHPAGGLMRNRIPDYLRSLEFIDSEYKVQGSIGQGNWVGIPWIAILDKRIQATVQRGEYIVYLFAEDMSAVYLTLIQGVTEPLQRLKKKGAYPYFKQKNEEIRSLLPLSGLSYDELVPGIGDDYQAAIIASVRYERGHVPNDDQLLADLKNVVDSYKRYADIVLQSGDMNTYQQELEEEEPMDQLTVPERIEAIKAFIHGKGFHFPPGLIENFYLSLKTKPFVILAGVSGTGKTKLVKLFAEALGATSANGQFSLIPVRPDWSDPSDLLGYKDLTGAFRPGKLAEVLAVAAQERNRHQPYFICLDEMNLARVEHYFSDLLSVIETQEWRGERIVTVPLLEAKSLAPEDQPLYGGLALPDNVYLIGTVNMDETTHPFSKKVLDRANTIEFNYIHLEQFPEAEEMDGPEAGRAANAFLRSEFLQLVDAYGEHEALAKRVTAQLVRVNGILEQVHAHVGFRIRDAVCFYMIYNEQFGLMSEDQAFDLQLLQKILPRVQGSSSSVKRVLLQLLQVALDRKLPLQDYLDDASELYLKWSSGSTSEETAKYPLSARKLAFMLRRLEEDGFTSYWLS